MSTRPIGLATEDLTIAVSGDVAFAHMLRKWSIAHEHLSLPVDLGSMRAVPDIAPQLDLRPGPGHGLPARDQTRARRSASAAARRLVRPPAATRQPAHRSRE
jgi:hypothetical protein